ncbi:hypothetical protein NQZ68_020687 [Dissostichus eleginoides]|nr:hypothetical protein NQZ68_020687 [Dissostichus eleginoides]
MAGQAVSCAGSEECLFPETIQELALHLMAELWVGVEEEEEEEESYWNHLNAAPVGSITFMEKTEDKVGRRGGGEGEEREEYRWLAIRLWVTFLKQLSCYEDSQRAATSAAATDVKNLVKGGLTMM